MSESNDQGLVCMHTNTAQTRTPGTYCMGTQGEQYDKSNGEVAVHSLSMSTKPHPEINRLTVDTVKLHALFDEVVHCNNTWR